MKEDIKLYFNQSTWSHLERFIYIYGMVWFNIRDDIQDDLWLR
jgi:hypothetical protein